MQKPDGSQDCQLHCQDLKPGIQRLLPCTWNTVVFISLLTTEGLFSGDKQTPLLESLCYDNCRVVPLIQVSGNPNHCLCREHFKLMIELLHINPENRPSLHSIVKDMVMLSKAALQPELQVQVQDNDLLQKRKCSVKVWRQVEQIVKILKKG